MRGHWLDNFLVAGMGLGVFGFIRLLMTLQTPAAADVPESLRGLSLRFEGDQWQPTIVLPSRREQDVAWGPRHRYRLLSQHGRRLRLELVVRRSRDWKGLLPSPLQGALMLTPSPHQQVLLGTIEGRMALRTCVVGRGIGELHPRALVEADALVTAVERWRDRLDGTITLSDRLWRGLAIQAGLRVSERWECLLVTITSDEEGGYWSTTFDERSRQQLLNAWRLLYPQLRPWGESWDGVNY